MSHHHPHYHHQNSESSGGKAHSPNRLRREVPPVDDLWHGHEDAVPSNGVGGGHEVHHQPSQEYPLLRLRADSNGSMRGAFTGQQRAVHMPHSHHHHHHHHHSGPPFSEGNSPRKHSARRKARHKSWLDEEAYAAHPHLSDPTTPSFNHDGFDIHQSLTSYAHEDSARLSAILRDSSSLAGSNILPAMSNDAESDLLDSYHRAVANQTPHVWNASGNRAFGTHQEEEEEEEENDDDEEDYIDEDYYDDYSSNASSQIYFFEDPWYFCTSWITKQLKHGVQRDPGSGIPYFPASAERSLAGLIRHYFFNPISPEFTSLQQFCWAIAIGIIMGIYTAVWKTIVESGVDFVWESVPAYLLEKGLFTALDGWFPLYHYMWIVPSVFGAILSYIFVILPVKIPGQNEWIASLHKSGVQDYRTFWPLFILSTLGMLSGLSLGPELPLVLTSGMFGSWLGLICRQSMLQARVLNLTAASAAIGGFFGFPMAGALFVLELPHRSGLQYFEALTPSTISSIVAVITNRLIVNNDVTGYFKYPFLATSLPSSIFWHAIVYGLFGCAVGSGYLIMVLWCKTWVHDWFLAGHDDHCHEGSEDPRRVAKNIGMISEASPTVTHSTESDTLLPGKTFTLARKRHVEAKSASKSVLSCIYSLGCVAVPNESHRAALAGALAGFVCGWVAIFVPHTLFWGEAQLQNLIDKGRTPLPVFGDSTGDMVALGYCIIDPSDPAAIKAGFSVGCAALISISKTLVIGLSLGTGIIGGHFWGPLFVGCAASHFFTDIIDIVAAYIGIGAELAAYPCLVILCTMGAAHVVSFRAHTAIMLILTLTISAFSPEDGNPYYGIAGDYSAVFPLLVISVSISMILSRDMFFYKEQRNRGDILAVPQVLCEPGMEGQPLVAAAFDSDEDVDGEHYEEIGSVHSDHDDTQPAVRSVPNRMTMEDIEESFRQTIAYGSVSDPYAAPAPPAESSHSARTSPLPPPIRSSPTGSVKKSIGIPPASPGSSPLTIGAVPPPPTSTITPPSPSSARLDELLAMPLDQGKPASRERKKSLEFHRRTHSLPNTFAEPGSNAPRQPAAVAVPQPPGPNRSRSNSSNRQDLLVRVSSFGEVTEHAPSLLEQARMQAASIGHRRVPSLTRGRSSRKNSASNASELGVDSGALSLDDIEQSFNNVVNARSSFQGNVWSSG